MKNVDQKEKLTANRNAQISVLILIKNIFYMKLWCLWSQVIIKQPSFSWLHNFLDDSTKFYTSYLETDWNKVGFLNLHLLLLHFSGEFPALPYQVLSTSYVTFPERKRKSYLNCVHGKSQR